MSNPPIGALSIDVEEHFHVSAFEGAVNRDDWPSMPSRVAQNTARLLDMFAARGAKATFFTLGIVARDHPDLVRRIAAEGHEVASHGWDHRRVFTQSRDEFAADVSRAKATLEDLSGQAVRGYRAASFSIDARTPWAREALAAAGYAYSSSSHPIKHDLYGDPNAPRGPYRDAESGLIEIPVSTIHRFGRRVTAGGGGFFRLLPLRWFTSAYQRLDAENMVPNFYLHPWEIDPGQPRFNAAPLRSRLRHYTGLSRCAQKLDRLLTARRWTRMDDAYHGWLDGA